MNERVPNNNCPNCHHELDAAACATGDDKPSPGDITICLYCGHLMAFAEGMHLRDLTDAEMNEVAGDPRIVAIQTVRLKVMNK